VQKYLNPLKNSENLIESYVVDEIFFQIPSILQHHEAFLEELQKRLDTWDLRQKIGDLFLDVSFSPKYTQLNNK
jgi:Rho guanine nucleotide exchange factor 17